MPGDTVISPAGASAASGIAVASRAASAAKCSGVFSFWTPLYPKVLSRAPLPCDPEAPHLPRRNVPAHRPLAGVPHRGSAGFLPLGLPPADEFWSAPAVPWTSKLIWSGENAPADHALTV